MKASKCFLAYLATITSARVVKRDTKYNCSSEQDATVFSLTYGTPLLAFEIGVKTNLEDTPINELATSTVLTDPEETAIVSPNVDTWYLSLGFDLSQEDIEIVIPEIEDRYYSVSFYDPYGENYVTFGAQDGNVAGKHLLVPARTGNNAGTLDKGSKTYKGVVYAPSTQGVLLVRLLMKDPSETKLLYEIADGFSTKMVDGDCGPVSPTLTSNDELFQNNSGSQAAHILNMTAWTEQTVPPVDKGISITPPTTTRQLEAAGIEDGEYDEVSCVNTTRALAASSLGIATYMADEAQDLGNDWQLPKVIDQYGADYRARASIASWGHLAMTPDVALYPKYRRGFRLQPNESLTLAFSGKPPLRGLGFWSLTLYDEDGYLVPNVVGRYAVSDRSNLTFADGTPLYETNEDGPFDVVIQAQQPDEKWLSNWLPLPSDGQGFDLVLRFYYAKNALSNGDYVYPREKKTPVHPRRNGVAKEGHSSHV